RPPPDRPSRRTHHQLSTGRRAPDDCRRLGGPYRIRTSGDSCRRHYRHRGRTLLTMDTFTRTPGDGPMTQPSNPAVSARSATLATQQLSLGYGSRTVVDQLNVEIPPGKVTAIVGPNGCGKSTLLAGLARILAPQSGAVLLDGRDINTLRTREVAHKLALLPQDAQ